MVQKTQGAACGFLRIGGCTSAIGPLLLCSTCISVNKANTTKTPKASSALVSSEPGSDCPGNARTTCRCGLYACNTYCIIIPILQCGQVRLRGSACLRPPVKFIGEPKFKVTRGLTHSQLSLLGAIVLYQFTRSSLLFDSI